MFQLILFSGVNKVKHLIHHIVGRIAGLYDVRCATALMVQSNLDRLTIQLTTGIDVITQVKGKGTQHA